MWLFFFQSEEKNDESTKMNGSKMTTSEMNTSENNSTEIAQKNGKDVETVDNLYVF